MFPFPDLFLLFCLLFITIIQNNLVNATCNCNIQMKEIEGKEINGYKVIKSIGKGKFSTVFYGENQNSMPVAVKEIKIFDMMDPKQREKCLKEVEIMKPLQHPNIIRYLDSFTYNNELIIITEWASKGDLKKVIKYHIEEEIPIEESKIWEYIIEISSGLKHMHEKRIMHRDLKPANIFVGHDNSLKIGDLGLGKAFGSETLEAHSKVGTPLYMAPELLSGKGYDFVVDVWSLGCIIYQLAELRSPFRSDQKMSLMDLFNNITRGQYKPVSSKYSPELVDLISKTIQINEQKRLTSAKVLEIAQENFSKCNTGPRIDCSITMDDIINKLNLLDYFGFCKVSGNKPIHRLYFALEDPSPNKAQFYLFLEICYWLMNLSKLEKNKEKAISQAKSMIDWKSPEDACAKFIKDVVAFGIRSEIQPKSILQGYGQGSCYLLNQLLNRQLIRINFKFQAAGEVEVAKESDQAQMQEIDEDDRLLKPQAPLEEDIEQTHDFERSVVFKRGAKKLGAGNTKLLEKIKEIDQEDYNIIYSKVDPYDWQTEVARVEKKLGDLSQHLKEAKKKSSFQNFQRTRSITPRVNQYTKFLKPLLYRVYTEIDTDLRAIEKVEMRVNSSVSQIKEQYTEQNKHHLRLNEEYFKLTELKQSRQAQLSRVETRLQEVISLSNNVTSSDDSNSVIRIKSAIQVMRRDIRSADINIELLSWQIRQYIRKENQKEFEINVDQEF